jgi:two-component system, chemotaxis family, CheB/CheR fusion protein
MARRILVVNDVPDAANSLGEVLKLQGYEVEVAIGGQEGYQKALQLKPTLMLVDLAMPAMSGCTLASRVRQTPELKDVGLIAVSGFTDAVRRELARAAGFDHYLVKPVDLNALEAIFASVCDSKPAL